MVKPIESNRFEGVLEERMASWLMHSACTFSALGQRDGILLESEFDDGPWMLSKYGTRFGC